MDMDKSEILFHTPAPTEAAFPYAVVAGGRTLTRRQDPPVMRRFNQHVLILTTDGAGLIRVNGRQRLARPGTLAWLDTGRDYAHACDPRHRNWQYLWLGVQGFGLDALFEQTRCDQDPLTRLSDPAAATDGVLAILHRMHRRTADLAAANSAGVAVLLALLIANRRAVPQSADPVPEQKIDRLLAHLRGTLAHAWTVPAMARIAALSQSQLYRDFRMATGQSPMTWLRNERINAAKPLLLDRRISVQAVAETVGYADPFHFSRDFRAIEGRPPRAFRDAGGA